MKNNENMNNQVNGNNISDKSALSNKKKLIIIVVVFMTIVVIASVIYIILATRDIEKNKASLNSDLGKNAVISEATYSFYGPDGKTKIAEYKCEGKCKSYTEKELMVCGSEFDAIINEYSDYSYKGYYIYNYQNKTLESLNIPDADYKYMSIKYDNDKKPASIFLTKTVNDEDIISIYNVKTHTIVDYNECTISDEDVKNHYIIYCKDSNYVYDNNKAKVVLYKDAKNDCNAALFENKGKVYYISNYLHYTGGDLSIEEIQTVDGKTIFKSNSNHNYNNDSNDMDYNYAIFDQKNDRIIIVDNHSNKFLIYDKDYNLIKESKKYDYIIPYNDDEIYTTTMYFTKNQNFYMIVNDNGKLNIIDYDENIISNISNINSNQVLSYVGSDNDNKNTINIYVNDNSLKIDDFTDDDIKRISGDKTRQDLIGDYNGGMIVLGYEYVYNISTKKVETFKNLYYTD